MERDLAPASTRVHDVVMNYPFLTRNRMRFVLPAGLVPRNLPQGSRIVTPHFEYIQAVTVNLDGYTVEETVQLKSQRIPVAAYAQLRQAAVEADKRMRLRVRLARGTP
jgi:hypothetical protein